ncbi:hypothetical protein A0256_19645 [Mucilaginibacter sp. PAMC 26640]|nr:hypothetical protein A0256_19645 [Mucilaginibacter sp. PAMC 26640]
MAKKSKKVTALSENETEKKVIFIQYDEPPLKAGKYTVTLEQQVNLNTGAPYTTTREFAVTGQRFTLNPNDFNSVFPPNLANGEFSGVFPLAVFNRRTLPWERTSVKTDPSAPWLALLLFNQDQVPEIKKTTVKDLVPLGTAITVEGSDQTGVGTMPASLFSYPGLNELQYGESPNDEVNVIDVPVTTFNQIAPSPADLSYLAHIRDTETIDKTDQKIIDEEFYSVVAGNRIPKDDAISYVFLVSLENFGDCLPGNDGANHLPVGTSFVRLITYSSWHFTVNLGNETFEKLLEGLNKNILGERGLTTLQYPFDGTAPTDAEIETALKNQADNKLTAADSKILVGNALAMGYVPLNQILRHTGNTVSWYRSSLTPLNVAQTLNPPFSTPDAINQYNPETGMFDVSYGSAWQIGQLMALQNKAYSTELYNWKKGETMLEAIAEEQKIIADKFKSLTAFNHIMLARTNMLRDSNSEPLPDSITLWLAQLALLKGLPFNYLVPDESMLPPETIRFFYMDNNWVDCLLDGAFSIGRSATADDLRDLTRFNKVKLAGKRRSKLFRPRKFKLRAYNNDTGIVTGFLLRSAVVGGWPGLEVNGYSDIDGKNEIQKLRMEALSSDTLICIFDGEVQMVAIHEPPEALHQGLIKYNNGWASTLRTLGGADPGSQIPGAYVAMTLRADGQTLLVQQAADSIKQTLNSPPYNEGIADFTSAEYALEMIKGVVKVEFLNKK